MTENILIVQLATIDGRLRCAAPRWMCGVTRKDRIRNENIQRNLWLAPIEDKILECHFRWFAEVHKIKKQLLYNVWM